MKYSIKIASRRELEIMIGWAEREGWNPGIYDAESFYSADPNGFFLGFLDDRAISSISAVNYGGNFGFLGFYIVKPEFRGKGFGIKIWNQAIKYLNGQNIGLDGVVTQQENYKKSGFKLVYRNIRFEGTTGKKNKNKSKLVNINTIPFNQLLEYDNKFVPVSRPGFLRKWIKQPECRAVGFVENSDLKGYGMIRRSLTGYRIGPLFADNEKIAEDIFTDLHNYLDFGTQFFLDIPEVNKSAVKLAENAEMKPMFETARMYTKSAPNLPLNKIFGVTTFELG